VYSAEVNGGHSIMNRRINITLPVDVLGLIDRAAKKGQRSRFIAEAVRHYIESVGRANLRRRLKEGAVRRADRDLRLAEEWFTLENEA
jgi:CopG family transcriptional regulator/antitoxin EndoAI